MQRRQRGRATHAGTGCGSCKPEIVARRHLPAWLNATIAKAIAIDPANRYGDVLEFAFEIENGAKSIRLTTSKRTSNRTSLYERKPLLIWQALCALLVLALAFALARRTIV